MLLATNARSMSPLPDDPPIQENRLNSTKYYRTAQGGMCEIFFVHKCGSKACRFALRATTKHGGLPRRSSLVSCCVKPPRHPSCLLIDCRLPPTPLKIEASRWDLAARPQFYILHFTFYILNATFMPRRRRVVSSGNAARQMSRVFVVAPQAQRLYAGAIFPTTILYKVKAAGIASRHQREVDVPASR